MGWIVRLFGVPGDDRLVVDCLGGMVRYMVSVADLFLRDTGSTLGYWSDHGVTG